MIAGIFSTQSSIILPVGVELGIMKDLVIKDLCSALFDLLDV